MCASTNGTSSRVGREWNGTRRLCINQRNQCDGDEDHGEHQRHGEARRKTRHGWLSYARCKESDISVYVDGRIEPGASERSWSICVVRAIASGTRVDGLTTSTPSTPTSTFSCSVLDNDGEIRRDSTPTNSLQERETSEREMMIERET